MKETLGIVGLGRMGMAAAKKYIAAGYRVSGYARRKEVVEEFTGLGGTFEPSPAAVARKADKVIVYVLNDQQVFDVVTGETGILEGSGPKSIVVCMATIDRDNLETVAKRCSEKSVGFLDCPVTGGPARIEAGTLTLIAAGAKETLESCRAILEAQGRIVYIGEKPGLGQAVKHCNQLLVGTTQAVTMEVITLARKSGLDARVVCDVVGSGIAGSDYFRILADSILGSRSSVGSLGQMCKDVGLVMNDARRARVPLVVASAAQQYYLSALALGLENADTAELIKVVDRLASPST